MEQDTEVDGIEDEDTTGEEQPWDPAKIRVDTKPWSLRQVCDEIDDGTIDLAPDFQRGYLWDLVKQVRLVESILLGIPLPAFYFNANSDNSQQVVDGRQRLTTIHRYMRGEFELTSDLQYLKQLVGRPFNLLDSQLKRRFQQTQIIVHVIDSQSPPDLKFNIFMRINTGGLPLSDQEIRHCIGRERSRALLTELSLDATFRRLTRFSETSIRRMEDREMILRFLAFYLLTRDDPQLLGYRNSGLDSLLMETTTRIDDKKRTSDEAVLGLRQAFSRAMTNAEIVFGDRRAFRRFTLVQQAKKTHLNRALFESWGVVLSDLDAPTANVRAPAIISGLASALEGDQQYAASIRQGTGGRDQVLCRFRTARRIVGSPNV